MRSRSLRGFRLAVLVVLASASPYVACSGDDTTATASSGVEHPELADVIYEGDTNDEALASLLAGTPQEWACKAGVFDLPQNGQVLPKDPPPTIAWHDDSSSGAGAALRIEQRLSPLRELIGPERAALAHGAPYDGTAFWLVFSTAHDDKLLRVFTGNTTYTPGAEAWAKLTGAGETITITIESAVFDQNLLTADGGPFSGSSVVFTVQ